MPRDDEPRRRWRNRRLATLENYRVVSADDLGALCAEVRELMDDGWEPAGGVSAVATRGPSLTYPVYMQAMILRKSPLITQAD